MIVSTSLKINSAFRTASTVLIMAFLVSCAKSPKQESPEPAMSNQANTQRAAQAELKMDNQPMPTPAPVRRVPTPIVRPAHPTSYTVKKGDTLWGIADVFLKTPWYWPEIWHVNTQIDNPHLIYPDDVISLVYINGQPQLIVSDKVGQRRGLSGTERMSPRIRVNPISQSINSIPLDAVEQFMAHPRVVTKEQLDESPYLSLIHI